MIAIKVTINGEKVCIAGREDLAVLSAIVNYVANSREKGLEPLTLNVGGFSPTKERNKHLNWRSEFPLNVGDKVEMELMEVDECDHPIQEYDFNPSDLER